MGKTVVVAPASVVMIFSTGWDEFLNELFEILDEAGFIFDGRQSGCGTRDKDRYKAALDLFIVDLLLDFASNVDDVAEAGSFFGECLALNLHQAVCTSVVC